MQLETNTKKKDASIGSKRPSTCRPTLSSASYHGNHTKHTKPHGKSKGKDSMFPPLLSCPNQSNQKTFAQHPYWEKEKLFDRCMKLQTSVHMLDHQIKVAKIENSKQEEEILRQNKMLNEYNKSQMAQSTESKLYTSQQQSYANTKLKEDTLLSNLKLEYKKLKMQYQDKEEELEIVKKKVKMTKIKEIAIEVEVYEKEMISMKQKLENALAAAALSENREKELKSCQERLKQKDKKITKLKYDNEKIVIATEAQVNELNKEIEIRNRKIVKLENDIAKMKLKQYNMDNNIKEDYDEKEEEEKKRKAREINYHLYIVLKKREMTIETIDEQAISLINIKGNLEDEKLNFASNLIELFQLNTTDDKAAALDFVTASWGKEKKLDVIKQNMKECIQKMYDDDKEKKKTKDQSKEQTDIYISKEQSKPKEEEDIMELEKLVKEKEKILKIEVKKIDSERKGIISFKAMRDLINKTGLKKHETEILIITLKPDSFNAMEYKQLINLGLVEEKYEYTAEEEAVNDHDIEQTTKLKDDSKEKNEEENNELLTDKIEDNKQQKATDKINESHDKDELIQSLYKITENIEVNEFDIAEYFKGIVKLYDNKKTNLEQVEGIWEDDFCNLLSVKDINIPEKDLQRLFEIVKSKEAKKNDIIDPGKLEKELERYMNKEFLEKKRKEKEKDKESQKEKDKESQKDKEEDNYNDFDDVEENKNRKESEKEKNEDKESKIDKESNKEKEKKNNGILEDELPLPMYNDMILYQNTSRQEQNNIQLTPEKKKSKEPSERQSNKDSKNEENKDFSHFFQDSKLPENNNSLNAKNQ